jgi:hypothetical protein
LYICERKQLSKDELCSEKVPFGVPWLVHGENLLLRSRSEKVPLGERLVGTSFIRHSLAAIPSTKGIILRVQWSPASPQTSREVLDTYCSVLLARSKSLYEYPIG